MNLNDSKQSAQDVEIKTASQLLRISQSPQEYSKTFETLMKYLVARANKGETSVVTSSGKAQLYSIQPHARKAKPDKAQYILRRLVDLGFKVSDEGEEIRISWCNESER